MKIDDLDWMDWLREMRRKEEEKRIREGISMTEWLRRVNIEADATMVYITRTENTWDSSPAWVNPCAWTPSLGSSRCSGSSTSLGSFRGRGRLPASRPSVFVRMPPR